MKIDVGYCVSNEYFKLMIVSITSILENRLGDEEYYFYILQDGISEENKSLMARLQNKYNFSFEYLNVDPNDFFNIASGPSQVTNYRLKIGSLRPELDKILFLDSDIIALKPLVELWQTDLGENYIGACIDPGVKLQYDYTVKHKEKFPDRRFNTGVLLIDLVKWREKELEKKIFDASVWYTEQGYEVWADQNAINMVCKDKTFELPQKFNACPILLEKNLYQDESLKKEAFDDPVIIHLAGRPKPWEKKDVYMSEHFWKYAIKANCYTYSINGSYSEELKPAFEKNYSVISMSSSKAYAPYLAVCLQSLKEYTDINHNYDVVIFESDISERDKEKLVDQIASENISLRFVNPSNYYEGVKLYLSSKNFAPQCYYRLTAPLVFNNYERVIFTDLDIIFRADIKDLYSLDIKGSPIASCVEVLWEEIITTGPTKEFYKEYTKNTLKLLPPYTYYNTGVVIFDVKKCNNENYFEEILKLIQENEFVFQEQCGLNRYFAGRFHAIDFLWNFELMKPIKTIDDSLYVEYNSHFDNAKIVHYLCATKPWNTFDLDKDDLWWSYARKTPFYEEILARLIQSQIKPAPPLTHSPNKAIDELEKIKKDLFFYNQLKLSYYKNKFLSFISLGEKKEQRLALCKTLDKRMTAVRKYLNRK